MILNETTVAMLALLVTLGGGLVTLAFHAGRISVRVDKLEEWQGHVQRKYFEARTRDHV